MQAYSSAPPQRIATGVPGLDAVLGGGLFRGDLYLVCGPAGSGKTIFGNQLSFSHAAGGGRAAYVVVLTETTSRMLTHLQHLGFFDPARVAKDVKYVSASEALEHGGRGALLAMVERLVRAEGSTLLVIDSAVELEEVEDTKLSFKRFLHQLQAFAALVGCTVLIISESRPDDPSLGATLFDGVLLLEDRTEGVQAMRSLMVQKLRGGDYLRGRHQFEITSAGLAVYPRIEALYPRPSRPPGGGDARASFDIAGLDDALDGGLLSGSCAAAIGASGTGKTLLGLHFLIAGARAGERGVYFGFDELPEVLLRHAAPLELDLAREVARGAIALHWQPHDPNIDAVAAQLFAAVTAGGARRVVVDSLSGLRERSTPRQRAGPFFASLVNELRSRGVTTLFTEVTSRNAAAELDLPGTVPSAVPDTTIFLRRSEIGGVVRRTLSILKARASLTDQPACEFTITSRGIELAQPAGVAATPRRERPRPERPRKPRASGLRRSRGE